MGERPEQTGLESPDMRSSAVPTDPMSVAVIRPMVMTLILGAYLLVSFTILVPSDDLPMTSQALLVAWASTLCNVLVLYYHYTRPAHPKFLMLRSRRSILSWHIVSGSVQLVSLLWAYGTGQPGPTIVAAATALLLHVPTFLYQTPIVFGAKAVMTPSYWFVIALHAFCAVRLLLDPSSEALVLQTYLALNTYMWCRVFSVLFQRFGLFRDSLYTVSIFIPGFVTFPAVIGPVAPLVLIGFILLYVGSYHLLYRPDDEALRYFFREHSRYSLPDLSAKQDWILRRTAAAGGGSAEGMSLGEKAPAKAVFSLLDQNQDGVLDWSEVEGVLIEWKASTFYRSAIGRFHGTGQSWAFEEFYRRIWRFRPMASPVSMIFDRGRTYSETKRADLVFDRLDMDRSGYVEAFELRMLLVEWGVPAEEVAGYVQHFDDNRDGRFSREEFRVRFGPIWRFCFHQMEGGRIPT